MYGLQAMADQMQREVDEERASWEAKLLDAEIENDRIKFAMTRQRRHSGLVLGAKVLQTWLNEAAASAVHTWHENLVNSHPVLDTLTHCLLHRSATLQCLMLSS